MLPPRRSSSPSVAWPSRWVRPTADLIGMVARLVDVTIVTAGLPLAQWLACGTTRLTPLLGFVIVCAGLMQLDLFRAVGL
jgi:hypothetical protein